ncbi:UDP-3-O-(3-hydroxymyristoyl)glucosamine N-acyltransferase [Leptospira fletcheri]|uniref:UDP-3-O-acyl-N-acetylglucosamine deacetylase n=1 Tax=Leptospira fletcheri TaxID=2484981 RepID=A0A4V3JE29_9LEPT|nr:UDP-3-O-acyl-N-acetylglucosamine deacetylase [Leptospira fletcheri]TGK13935.1 UDP-3-O-(3-hydroxymyristoyl)glucosamine N-acyltransferase [Leptospira fletcheri]
MQTFALGSVGRRSVSERYGRRFPLSDTELSTEFEIIRDSSRLDRLREARSKEILFLPDHFLGMPPVSNRDFSYTVEREFILEGKATFENRNSRVTIRPATDPKRSSFSWKGNRFPLHPSYCIKGNHNIQLGEVKIIEHPLAWMLAYGVYADLETTESSFPTFDNCDLPYSDGLKDNFRKLEKRKPIFPSSPFAMEWEKGYCILEPPTNSKDSDELILDHQVSYPGTSVGNSRIQVTFGPETFSYFCDARTTAFRTKPEAEKFHQIGLAGGLKDYPFTLENVLLLDEDRIYNSREKFQDSKTGKNFEFLCHELIDICAWLRFVEEEYSGRFVGRMTTYLFDHHKQIDISRFACDPERLAEFDLQILG